MRVHFLHICLTLILLLLITEFIFAQQGVKKFEIEDSPEWIKKYPNPEIKEEYDLDLVLVHRENQYNHVTKEHYERYFYYLRTVKGRNQINSFFHNFEPSYQTFHLNEVNVYRGDKRIVLDEQLHVEYKIEGKQVGGERYDDDAKINIFFDNTEVGDLLEICLTTKGIQPDTHGRFSCMHYLERHNLRGTDFFRVIVSNATPLYHKMMNTDLKPTIVKEKNITSLELISQKKKENELPETPIWYTSSKRIYCFEFNTWEGYLLLNLKNFRLEDPVSDVIKNKVEELVENTKTLPNKILEILNYVQREINYLDYGLIDPKRPETVIKQGFGDCKSKSLLAIKMLEHLNVEAWPLIVNMDGLEDRKLDIYNGQIMDHCVIEFIFDGDTILFDSTRDFQRGGLNQKYYKDFKYGLRIRDDSKRLVPIKPFRKQKISVMGIANKQPHEYDLGTDYYMNWKVTYEGDVANLSNGYFQKGGVESILENTAKNLTGDYYFSPDKYELSYDFNETKPFSKLTVSTKSYFSMFGRHPLNNDSLGFAPAPLNKSLQIVDSSKLGPYFKLPDLGESEFIYKIPIYEGMEFNSDTTEFKSDWIQYKKKVWLEKDTIMAFYQVKSLKLDMDSSEFSRISNEINFIKNDIKIIVTKPDISASRDSSFNSFIQSLFILLSIIGVIGFIVGYLYKRKQKFALLQKENSQLKNKLATFQKTDPTSLLNEENNL